MVSLWEVVVKGALDRTDFRVDANLLRRGLVDNGYLELPIDGHHVLAVSTWPAIHRDPFDRVLVAQARSEGLVLLTADRALEGYGPPVRLV